MDLSPNDIRTYEFPSQMRGYDKDEVDNFLDQTALALENSKQENLNLSMEVDSLKTQIATLKEYEDAIKKAAIDARRNADATTDNAKNEANEILLKAKEQAENLVSQKETEVIELKKQIINLEDTKKSFIVELRNLIKNHNDMVNDIEEEQINENLSDSNSNIQVTESEDLTRDTMETVAASPVSEDEAQTEYEEEVDQAIESQKQIDPELAQALEQYQKPTTVVNNSEDIEQKDEHQDTAPKPGEFVETDKSAEDVPDGFIAGNEQENNISDTDRVNVLEEKNSEQPPSNIADELDDVVATFEEEMNKADKK